MQEQQVNFTEQRRQAAMRGWEDAKRSAFEATNSADAAAAYSLGFDRTRNIPAAVFADIDTQVLQGASLDELDRVAADALKQAFYFQSIHPDINKTPFYLAQARVRAIRLRKLGFTGESIVGQSMKAVQTLVTKDKVPIGKLRQDSRELAKSANERLINSAINLNEVTEAEARAQLLQLAKNAPGQPQSPMWIDAEYGCTNGDMLVLLGENGNPADVSDAAKAEFARLLMKSGVTQDGLRRSVAERVSNITTFTARKRELEQKAKAGTITTVEAAEMPRIETYLEKARAIHTLKVTLRNTLTRRQGLEAERTAVSTAVAPNPSDQIQTPIAPEPIRQRQQENVIGFAFDNNATSGFVNEAIECAVSQEQADSVVGDVIVLSRPQSGKREVAKSTYRDSRGVLVSRGGQDVAAACRLNGAHVQAVLVCADGVSLPQNIDPKLAGIDKYKPSAHASLTATNALLDQSLTLGLDPGNRDQKQATMQRGFVEIHKRIKDTSSGGETVASSVLIMKDQESGDTYMVNAWVGDPNIFVLGRRKNGSVLVLPTLSPADLLDRSLRVDGHDLEKMTPKEVNELREQRIQQLVDSGVPREVVEQQYVDSGIYSLLGAKDSDVHARSYRENLTDLAEVEGLVEMTVMTVSDCLGDKIPVQVIEQLYSGSTSTADFATRLDKVMADTDLDDGSAAMAEIRLH